MKKHGNHHTLLILIGILSVIISSETIGSYMLKGTDILSYGISTTVATIANISSIDAARQAHESVSIDFSDMSADVSSVYSETADSVTPILLRTADNITDVSIGILDASEKFVLSTRGLILGEF